MKASELFEEVSFEVGTRTRLTLMAVSEDATVDGAFEYANEFYPSSEDEEWDTYQGEIYDNGEIVLHR